jgi:hypothetical protein
LRELEEGRGAGAGPPFVEIDCRGASEVMDGVGLVRRLRCRERREAELAVAAGSRIWRCSKHMILWKGKLEKTTIRLPMC